MFYLIKTIYNYIRVCFYINDFYKRSQIKDIQNYDITNFVTQIIPHVKSAGCVCIKFCQWLTPIMDNVYTEQTEATSKRWLHLLEQFYENCGDHSIEHTLKIYKQDFKEDLFTDYEIIDTIGSGSIGQVYKLKDKHTNKYFALKIVHPTCKYDMKIFKSIMRVLLCIPYTRNIIYDILPYDIDEFLRLFEQQLDMVQEANNLCRFKYNYKDNHKIVIPDLLKCSHNCLVMTYEEGVSMDDVTISEYEKMKLSVLFYLFGRHNFEHANFNHADLHKGNWKITSDNNLLIYDFGYCFSINNRNIIDNVANAFIETSEENGSSKFDTIVMDLINDHSKDTHEYIHNYLDKEFYKGHKLQEPSNLLKHLFSIAKHFSIQLHPLSIQTIIIQIQNLKYLIKYSINNFNEKRDTGYHVYRRDYLNYYSIIKTYNIFPELQTYFKKILNEKQVDINGLFDVVDEKSGITNEIKCLLSFD